MLVGCYTLDLYCDTGGDPFGGNCPTKRQHPAQFTGQTLAECIRNARKTGWSFDQARTLAYCPQCTRLEKKRWKAIAAVTKEMLS